MRELVLGRDLRNIIPGLDIWSRLPHPKLYLVPEKVLPKNFRSGRNLVFYFLVVDWIEQDFFSDFPFKMGWGLVPQVGGCPGTGMGFCLPPALFGPIKTLTFFHVEDEI